MRSGEDSEGDLGGPRGSFFPVASPMAQALESPGDTAFCAGIWLQGSANPIRRPPRLGKLIAWL